MIFRRSSRAARTTFAVSLLLPFAASAAPPAWWSAGNPPVIDPNATEQNKGIANIGQAKWMAKNALEALRSVLPETAALIETDLVGVGKPIASWDTPGTPAEQTAQRSPLLIGQLKAITAPFYIHLKAAAPGWLASEMSRYGLPAGDFPWTVDMVDDANKSPAVLGQLKAAFSLDFTGDQEAAADGLPDLWEERHFGNLSQTATGDPDNDGFSNLTEYHAGTSPVSSANPPVMAVAAGSYHSLALAADGRVWAWGYNGSGELGDRTTTERNSPVPVAYVLGMGKIVKISAGGNTSMALDESGALWGWGGNGSRQILRDTTQNILVPTRVSFPSAAGAIVSVSCGREHMIALDETGGLWVWGDNHYGQLGFGDTTDVTDGPRLLPKPAAMGSVVQVLASWYSSYVLDSNGIVWAWGRDYYGELGKGSSNSSDLVPAVISAPVGFPIVKSISSKDSHVLALGQDGTLWGWGENHRGQLGLGDYTGRNAPVKIESSALAWKTIGTGHDHSLAVTTAGETRTTGYNSYNYCLLGTAASTLEKTSAFAPTSSVPGWQDPLMLDGSQQHSVALTPDGGIWTWGSGSSGKLGHGNSLEKGVPTKIAALSLGTDDSDFDDLPDSWEKRYFGDLSKNGQSVTAGGLTLATAYLNHLDPSSGDSDLDLMPDAWEIAHGLNPHDDTDALDDADGDRIPNLWECKRGTNPTDSSSKPAADLIVDAVDPGTATDNRHATITAAVNAAPSGSTHPTWYHIIEVKSGVYTESVALPTSKRIALLGEPGASIPEIRNPTLNSSTLIISGSAFVDGFRITNARYRDFETTSQGYPGIDVNYDNVRASVSNTIIHDQKAGYGAAVRMYADFLRLSHITIFDCAGQNSAHSIYVSGGDLEIADSIIRGNESPDIPQVYVSPNARVSATRSFIRGGEIGASPADPLLTPRGLLKSGSPAIDAGETGVAADDIHGETRAGAADAGADEFRDADSDGLPDWLENQGVLNLSADQDSDGLANLAEYELGANPLAADSDGDSLNDGAEIAAGANPLWTDSDADLMPDNWEVTHSLNPTNAADALEDADGDRIPNLYEFANATNPRDAASVPTPHIIVDPATVTETATQKKTISAAISAAPTITSNPTRFNIIAVKSGIYVENATINDRRILLIGEAGASPPVISPVSSSAALTIYENRAVVDGFIFRKNPALSSGKGIGVYLDNPQHESRMINCMITGQTASFGAGIECHTGRLSVIHCTLTGNSGSHRGRAIFIGNSGYLNLVNSIVWNPIGTATMQIDQYNIGSASVTTSIILGAEFGASGADPKFDRYYGLMADSPAIGAGSPQSNSLVDLHGEIRPLATPDIGADQRVDSDGDTLLDWWERKYFENLSKGPNDDNDSPQADRLINYHEYLLGFDPLNPDTKMTGNWDALEALSMRDDPWYPAEWKLDPDKDNLTTGLEIAFGFDPLNPNSTGTGIFDSLIYHLGYSSDENDWDSDGRTNQAEALLGTNPFVDDSDGDGTIDGDDFFPLDPTRWDSPGATGGDVTAPVITLSEPVGAVPVP